MGCAVSKCQIPNQHNFENVALELMRYHPRQVRVVSIRPGKVGRCEVVLVHGLTPPIRWDMRLGGSRANNPLQACSAEMVKCASFMKTIFAYPRYRGPYFSSTLWLQLTRVIRRFPTGISQTDRKRYWACTKVVLVKGCTWPVQYTLVKGVCEINNQRWIIPNGLFVLGKTLR